MAGRRTGRGLTPLELEIMQALWSDGPSTVEDVRGRLPAHLRLAYTTVQTMLNVLYRKGKVKRTLKGRAFEYTPTVSRKKAISAAMRELIDRMFGGSPENLVITLVEGRQLTAEKLAKLTRLAQEAAATSRRKETSHADS